VVGSRARQRATAVRERTNTGLLANDYLPEVQPTGRVPNVRVGLSQCTRRP
jgi:hypothetical protein